MSSNDMSHLIEYKNKMSLSKYETQQKLRILKMKGTRQGIHRFQDYSTGLVHSVISFKRFKETFKFKRKTS